MELWKLIVLVLYVWFTYLLWFKNCKNIDEDVLYFLVYIWIICTVISFFIIYTYMNWSFLNYKVF